MNPLVSICIPAYKRTEYLERLLDSVAIQTFRDFEVVISDDSSDDSVQTLVDRYRPLFDIQYTKNAEPYGTPANWNHAIRLARGEWIKIMHDDDWFAHAEALGTFVAATKKYPDRSFFFSAYQNVTQETNAIQQVRCNWPDQLILSYSPLHLFKKNYIGNPSCTLIRKDIDLLYDTHFKWVVDFEYYIRCLQKVKKYRYIDEILLNIGFNVDQVTQFTFRVPAVEIPESYRLIDKLGYRILRNILVYDYYWRFHRNLQVRGEGSVKKYYTNEVHPLLKQVIRFQQGIPLPVLRVGILSKIFMLYNYCISRFRKL